MALGSLVVVGCDWVLGVVVVDSMDFGWSGGCIFFFFLFILVVVIGSECGFAGLRRKSYSFVGRSCFKEKRETKRKREKEEE